MSAAFSSVSLPPTGTGTRRGLHDRRHKDIKKAVGHFYSLKLRTHTLVHLIAGEGLHEHDMSAPKRVKPKVLRLKLLYASP